MPSKKDYIKGRLEVKAIRRTQMGNSDMYIDEGSLGYVLGTREGHSLVFWPHKHWRDAVGSHADADLQATGRRG